MDNLEFLTITSGDTQLSPLSAVAPTVRAGLRPLVRAGKGGVPGRPGCTFQLTNRPGGGGAFFSVARGENILAAAAVVYAPEAAEELWQAIEQIHLNTYEVMMKLLRGKVPNSWLASPERPQHLPWLALALQPGLMYSAQDAIWLADFERCLAWTVIELRADFFTANPS